MRRLLPVVLLAVLAPAPAAHARPERRTPNLTVEYKLPYVGGGELTTDGRYVFAGQWNGRYDRYQYPKQGGVRIFDTLGLTPTLVGTIACAGTDMDVAVPRPGVLVVAHHYSACGVRGNGVTVFDVADPAKPKKLASLSVPSAHTLTAVPGTDIVYVSPGGLGNGAGQTTVIDVANPAKPKIVRWFAPNFFGCHDVTFGRSTIRLLGVCTGYEGVEIWDLTDPVRPSNLARIDGFDGKTGDYIQFAHGAAISPDGMVLVVNDEAFFEHRCDGKGDFDFGSLHLYDISDPTAPKFRGRIVPPRGASTKANPHDLRTWCTSHQLNFAPASRRLVNAWFSGGISVWDLTDLTKPREEAYYQASNALTWTAHWFNNRIWVNDMNRGVEVLRLSVLPGGGPVSPVGAVADAPVSPAFRPAGMSAGRLSFPRRARPSRDDLVCAIPPV